MTAPPDSEPDKHEPEHEPEPEPEPEHDQPEPDRHEPEPDLSGLPAGFRFGVSTAAYSIEGSADADGRAPSVWDVLSSVPGRIADGSTGAHLIDHYRRHAQDIALLAELGVDAYRFSLSWSRVQPDGRGAAQVAGLDFYDRLVDQLLAAGIDPWVTVYHWDLPLALMTEGGWLARTTADRLGDLSAIVARRIGDRVSHWTTLADPLSHMAFGHALGVDAPGLTLLRRAFTATHHLLLGHARARQALSSNTSGSIGVSLLHTATTPATPSYQDRVAAALYDAYHNRQFTEPILVGRYPRLLQPMLDDQPDLVLDGDLGAISAPLDFYGVDYFHPTVVAAAPDNSGIPFAVVDVPGARVTDVDWLVDAPSMTAVLIELTRRYPRLPQLFITANGAAYTDLPGADDQRRIAYLAEHLAAVADAVAAGVDVRGYFHRGLTDAWEGAEGYLQQFGLVAVDEESRRTPRASYDFLARVIRVHRSRVRTGVT